MFRVVYLLVLVLLICLTCSIHFIYSFIWRFTIRSCAIDSRESAGIHRTSLSKSNYTRRFSTVCIYYYNPPISSVKMIGFNLNRNHGWSEEEVLQIMLSLQSRGIIKAMAFNSFTRIHHEDTEIKVIIVIIHLKRLELTWQIMMIFL